MKAFQEITEWNSDFAVPNHVYFLNDGKDKMYGYVRETDGLVQVFNKPYRFYVRGRKFTEVKNTWNVSVDDTENPSGQNWQVSGSKGDTYMVSNNKDVWTCTCSGFKFRSQCRHVTEIQQSK